MAEEKKKSEWLEWFKAILVAFGIVFIVRMFLFAPIIVDGPSMLPTLHDRDQMIVNKFSYTIGEPDRFDIVVFHASEDKDFIKRVVGLPGEHVAMVDNILYVNGTAVEESFLNDDEEETRVGFQAVQYDFQLEDLPGHYSVIPDEHILVLGDNRGNSTDSRMFGVVSMDEVVGKTSFIYWPLNRIELVGK